MFTAYRCRAYPDAEQQALLNRTFGCVRVVWNRTLEARHQRYATEGKRTSYAETDKALTAMKREAEFAFLREVSSVPLQQTLRHQQQAFEKFFNKSNRYPRFKSRRGKQKASFTRMGFTWYDGGDLTLAKTSRPLRYVWTWPDIDRDEIRPTMVIVTRDAADRWFVTLRVEAPQPPALPATGEVVGVDLGLKDFAVLSNGERIPYSYDAERYERRVKRYQRKLERCQRGSANRAKATVKAARAHAKFADVRRDFLQKTSTDLIRRFDGIALEDLCVRNMQRRRSLAHAITWSGWFAFRQMLEYKAERSGRTVAIVSRWYPSTKTCSACGHLLAEISLGTRHWTCPACGTLHDRDINAAKNIVMAAGLVASACGGDVRQRGATRLQLPVKQETPGGDPGNPPP